MRFKNISYMNKNIVIWPQFFPYNIYEQFLKKLLRLMINIQCN